MQNTKANHISDGGMDMEWELPKLFDKAKAL